MLPRWLWSLLWRLRLGQKAPTKLQPVIELLGGDYALNL